MRVRANIGNETDKINNNIRKIKPVDELLSDYSGSRNLARNNSYHRRTFACTAAAIKILPVVGLKAGGVTPTEPRDDI